MGFRLGLLARVALADLISPSVFAMAVSMGLGLVGGLCCDALRRFGDTVLGRLRTTEGCNVGGKWKSERLWGGCVGGAVGRRGGGPGGGSAVELGLE